jgi:spore coat polysaccharide biosynthesis protein SpsF (cytidylyltransferase family)
MPATTHAIAVIDLGDCARWQIQQSAARFAPRKLRGQPLVVRMVRRLSECTLVKRICIVGANLPRSLFTAGLAGVEILDLPVSHACERLCAAADRFDADWVVFVPANRPFIDAALVDQLLARAAKTTECDYLGYASGCGDWRRMDHLGLAGEVCHADTLRRLKRNADRMPLNQGGCLAGWLENAPGAYHLRFIPVPAPLDRNDLRFAIEDESDWDQAELLCETVAGDDSEWQELTQLVISNDHLRESMATRNE